MSSLIYRQLLKQFATDTKLSAWHTQHILRFCNTPLCSETDLSCSCLLGKVYTDVPLSKGPVLQRQPHYLCSLLGSFRKAQNQMKKPSIMSVSYLPLKSCCGSQLHSDIPRRKCKCWCFSRDRGTECQGGFGDSSRCHQFHVPHGVDCKRETSGNIEVMMINYLCYCNS